VRDRCRAGAVLEVLNVPGGAERPIRPS